MDSEEKRIVEYYQKIWDAAVTLAEKDVGLFPLRTREKQRDRFEKHLLGMMELYSIRYGDPDQRMGIVNFLEKQLFREVPVEGEVCHLTVDMWKDLRQTILLGEYQEAIG